MHTGFYFATEIKSVPLLGISILWLAELVQAARLQRTTDHTRMCGVFEGAVDIDWFFAIRVM